MLASEYPVALDEKKLAHIKYDMLSFFTDAKDYKIEKGYVSLSKENYRFYRGIPITKPTHLKFQSNYWKPLSFVAVESITPRLVGSIFATDPFFRYLSLNTKNREAQLAIDNLSSYVNYKLIYEVPYILQLAKAIKNSLVYGWSLFYSPWLTQHKRIRVSGKDGKKVFTYKKTIDAPWGRSISIWDAYPQAGIESVHEGVGCTIRENVTGSTLLQRTSKPNSIYIKEMVDKLLFEDEYKSYPEEDTQNYLELDAMLGLSSSVKENVSKIELLHYWGCYDLEGDNSFNSDTEVHIILANRTTIISCIPNPYDCQERPFEELRPAPNTHGLLGWPIPQMGRDIQLEGNDLMNFRLDNLKFVANKVTKARINSTLYDKLLGGDVVIYPGATIPVDQQEDLMEMNFGSVDPALYTEDSIITNEYDKAIGLHDINYGAGDARARTASGTAMVIKESNYRLDLMLKHLQPSISSLLQKVGYFSQQLGMISPDERYLLPNPDLRSGRSLDFGNSMMQGAFMTLMLGSSSKGDKAYQFALFQSLYSLTAQDPTINRYEFNREMFEAGEVKNLDLILKKLPVTSPNTAPEGAVTEEDMMPSGAAGGMAGLGGPTEDKSNLNNRLIEGERVNVT